MLLLFDPPEVLGFPEALGAGAEAGALGVLVVGLLLGVIVSLDDPVLLCGLLLLLLLPPKDGAVILPKSFASFSFAVKF